LTAHYRKLWVITKTARGAALLARAAYHFPVATEYGGQSGYGGQAGYGRQGGYGGQPEFPLPGNTAGSDLGQGQPGQGGHTARAHRPHRGRFTVTVIVFVLGLAGLTASVVGVATQLLPRKFTPAQQQQIMAWEVGKRWRVMPAGTIFPASVGYPPPDVLFDDSSLTLTARRVGIARQASCRAAADSVAAAVLDRNGCAALLRATYVDETDSYVMTVGVAAFPGAAQAGEAVRELAAIPGKDRPGGVSPGVRTVRFAGTPATGFTDSRRQISASISDGPYVVLYAIGYADGRPRVPIAADNYADSEMTSMGVGVADAIAKVLGTPPPPPHCPGTPGC
jgi:hypothetical protein